MDLETAIRLVVEDEIGIRAKTKDEAHAILECAKHLSSYTAGLDIDDALGGVPETWSVFGYDKSLSTLTWWKDNCSWVDRHDICEASELLAAPIDSSAVADLL